MTREEEIDKAGLEWFTQVKKYDADVATAFLAGAQWADSHPHWKSVDNELPPRNTFFNISNIKNEDIEKYGLKDRELDSSIGCLVVIRGGMLGFANYNYKEKAWSTACCDEVTHWMPLPQAPVLSNSSNTRKNHLIDANNMIEGGEG